MSAPKCADHRVHTIVFLLLMLSFFKQCSQYMNVKPLPTPGLNHKGLNHVSPEYVKYVETGKWESNVMETNYSRELAFDPSYMPVSSKDVKLMNCAAKGKYPFYMYKGGPGGTQDWVCNDGGERKVTSVMIHVFSKFCENPEHGLDNYHTKSGQPRGLMLDVGSNLGYYGLLSLKMGCEAIMFDLQPECQHMINNAIIINNFVPVGRMMPYGVSNAEVSFKVSSSSCNGRFPATDF